MPSTHPLSGKTAIVTGASRGIGLAVAAALIGEGATVIGTSLTSTHDEEARARLRASCGDGADRFELRAVDVRDYAAVERLVNTVAAESRGIAILVNNAGIGAFSEVAAQPLHEWREVIDTNLTGVFHCCRAVVPHMKRRGGGWIVNISSLASKNPFVGAAAYCASKAALNAFSEVLMQEVRYDDIRVSYVLPGSVRTEFAGSSEAGAEWKLAPEDVARVVLDLVLHDPRSLPSRVEIRPSKPKRKA